MAITEIIMAYPRASIITFAALISLFISLINYFVLDKDKVRSMKARQKELNKEMKEHKDNPAKVMELQKELMSHVGENFKHSFKPMLITIIPVLVAFLWVKGIFAETSIASSWFWYYLISAIAFSMIFRKVFKLP
jgi:uncharacterized membrane protein (DUF106 family)